MKTKNILIFSILTLCSYNSVQPLFKLNKLEQSIRERASYAWLLKNGPYDNSTIEESEVKEIEKIIKNICKNFHVNRKKTGKNITNLKNIVFKTFDFKNQNDARKIAIITACMKANILKVYPVK